MTSKKLFIFLVSIFCCAICLLSLCACTDSQKTQAITNFGKEKAYVTYEKSIVHLKQNSTISYYIDDNVTGKYRTAVIQAISIANSLTDDITINANGTPDSKFRIVLAAFLIDDTTAIAKNRLNVDILTTEITSSTITLTTAYLANQSPEYILYTVLHELGHTFGLGHITDSRMSGYTVMFSPHPQGNDGKLTDYTEFDRYNIDWYYGK